MVELFPMGKDLALVLAGRRRSLSFRGLYQSGEEARRHVPPRKVSEYDIVNKNKAAKEEIEEAALDTWFHDEDYPLLFWLSRVIGTGTAVLELGGSVGHFFYSIQRYLELPLGLTWTIAELPEAVRLGLKLAGDRGESRLRFVDSSALAGAEPAPVFLSAGTLQYMGQTLPQILKSLRQLPDDVLIHKLPAHKDREYWTLQNLRVCEVPYRIHSRARLLASMEALGYELVASWRKPRTVDIPFHLDLAIEGYLGFFFRKVPGPAQARQPESSG